MSSYFFTFPVDFINRRLYFTCKKVVSSLISQRLKALRAEKNMSQKELASKLFVSAQAVSKWERDEATPNPDTIIKMADIFGVSTDSLLGKNSSLNTAPGINIPVLGDVAAGIPIEAIQDIVDYEEIDATLASAGEFFGLRLKGASMEPRMRDGDVVIVRKQDDAETGDIAVVMVNGDSATVKRIKKEPSGITLIPNNPAYDPTYYSNAEIQSLPVRIIGKVVELRAKF